MLPTVSKRIDEMSVAEETSHKSKKSKKSKKSSKKHKKEKKSKKSKKKKKYSSSSDSDASSDEEKDSDGDEWVEKSTEKVVNKLPASAVNSAPIERDDWLGGFAGITTFTKSAESKERKKPDERKGIDAYDPSKCARELNPYWKDGGTGLPTTFAKPKADSDDEDDGYGRRSKQLYRSEERHRDRQSNWRKKSDTHDRRSPPRQTTTIASSTSKSSEDRKRRSNSASSSSSSASLSRHSSPDKQQPEPQGSRDDFLTDQQMNSMAAKMLKAEIMGNADLAKELKEKLDRARQFRVEHKKDLLAKSFDRRNEQNDHQRTKRDKNEDGEDVLLTRTNSKGMSRPVIQNDSELWGGRAGRKVKKHKVETHVDGERVRYFADDDKYDIKQMVKTTFLFYFYFISPENSLIIEFFLQRFQFQSEKFLSAADSDMQFANIAGKHKNPNDDLEDIFADKVRENVDERELERKERDRAIREHQHMEKTLDTCERCFDSSKFEKQLMVSMGKTVYLSIPWHEGLQPGKITFLQRNCHF